MAIQILPQNSTAGSLGRASGEAIGGGLGGLIHGLAEGKLKKMQDAQKRSDLKSAFPEIPDEALDFLAKLPEKEQLEYLRSIAQSQEQKPDFHPDHVTPEQREQIKQYLSQPEALKAHTQEEIAKLQRFLNPAPTPAQQEGEVDLKKSTIPGLEGLLNAGSGQEPNRGSSSPAQSFPEIGHGTSGQAAPMEGGQPYRNDAGINPSTSPQKGISLSSLKKPGTAITQYQKERLALSKEQLEHAKNAPAEKTAIKYVENVYDKAQAKTEEDAILKRIIHISEKDDVRNPVLSGVMKQIGVDYEGLKNGNTLELEKLSNWFLRGGVKMFGGKVSNAEMGALLRQVPNALQTNEGRIRLAKQMLLANKDFHEEKKLVQHMVEENGYRVPEGIRFKIDKDMDKIREKNAKKFIEGIYDEEEVGNSSFKVGQKVNSIEGLPDGAQVTKGGKKYIIKNGKPVPKE